jgi:uncharacterized protein YgbK (DUF1537 family)
MATTKIVVIDDDPTGSQTVHSCPLLLRWDPATLQAGLQHPSPLLFLLANTRALPPEQARERVTSICRALRQTGQRFQLVSRSDSTLRGHFPIEVDAIAAELGPFDATLLVPAFLEGGRTTRGAVHRLHGQPVHETPFARDGLFGYTTSDLRAWVEEKSGGRVAAGSVQHLSLSDLEAPAEALQSRLASLSGIVAVDAERPEHLQALAAAVRRSSRRFLIQSAAGMVAALADLPPQPLDAAGLARLRRRGLPGLVVVGSHVPLADAQLERLLTDPGCRGVELPLDHADEAALLAQLRAVLANGLTPVLFTTRGERTCRHAAERRALGLALAGLMARLAATLAPQLGYIISKGGITTHTLLADGLGVASVQLQGQLLPGLSLVLAGPEALPVLTFPGNLGEAGTLWDAWRLMA